MEDISDSPVEPLNVLIDKPPLSAENLPTNIQTLRQKIMDHLPTEHGQRSYLPKLRNEITDEILAQTNLALETIPTANNTEPNARIYANVRTLQENVRRKGSRPQAFHNAWQNWLEMKIKRVRLDVRKLNEIAKKNVTEKQEWLRKLRDTLPATLLETAKQHLVALPTRLKRYNSENEARTINKLFSTDAVRVNMLSRNGNQSVEQPNPHKSETEMF